MELISAAHPIYATVTVPGSKSISNRALLIASLSQGISRLDNLLMSDDTVACMEALKELGVTIELDQKNHCALITGCKGHFPKKRADIFCRDAGTVARFLLAACAMNEGVYRFSANAVLAQRPMQPLYDNLRQLGAEIFTSKQENFFCEVRGHHSLFGGEVVIESDASSQFASAILMIAPFFQNPLTLILKQLQRRSYISLTCRIMEKFGVKVDCKSQYEYRVPLLQHYQACDYTIEPDLSTASYFFAAAAVTQGKITVKNIDYGNCMQGDKQFLTVLAKMGCEVDTRNHQVTVTVPEQLQGVEVNMQDFSDTFMTLAAIAPFAQTKTIITGIAHTQLQESKRIDAMYESLKKLNVTVEKHSDGLIIYPSAVKSAIVHSCHDHRLAMALSIIGLKAKGIILEGAESVKKTFPDFFETWEKMLI